MKWKNLEINKWRNFESFMNKIKEISNPISYKNLQTKYFNSYFTINPKKEKIQQSRNMKSRDELEVELIN